MTVPSEFTVSGSVTNATGVKTGTFTGTFTPVTSSAPPPVITGTLNGPGQVVGLGPYTLQVNEWDSSQPEILTYSYPPAAFTITGDKIANSTNGAPGAYSSFYYGNHFGASSTGSKLPLAVTSVIPHRVTTSVAATLVDSGAWDFAYDIWFCDTPGWDGNHRQELMIWLSHLGGVQPGGAKTGTTVIGGVAYDVWSSGSGNVISYVAVTTVTSVMNLDMQPFIADLVHRGILPASWYLVAVECGFEIWQGGTGLAVSNFSVII